ncbi:DUF4232 domain-containing protein [Kitasatospora sp. NPDC085895]|uniref:DUF4232 domain-containing protein n=1 Tax=Kitasatospora sp. NPDC085895 TaxID=3155057 RepID=UPI00344BB0E6
MRVRGAVLAAVIVSTAGAIAGCDRSEGAVAVADRTRSPGRAEVVPECAPAQLSWMLRVVAEAPKDTDEPPRARLTATKTGPGQCVFGGYPWFRVHIGKAEEAVAVPGRQTPPRHTVPPGASVSTDLFYSVTPDTSGRCFMPADASPQAQVLPPHAAADTTASAPPLTDRQGNTVQLAVCGEDIWMAAPVLA